MSAITQTLGLLEIGILISIFLFGVVTVQTFTYYRKFYDDKSLLKIFVGVIWAAECVHAIVISHMLYYYSVMRYGDPGTLIVLTVSGDVAVFVTGIICPGVQAFFVHRIRVLSSKWLFPCVLWFLCLLRSIGNFAVGAICHQTPNVVVVEARWRWVVVTTLAISEVNDVLIAVTLCYYLWPHRDTSLARTRVMVDKLLSWTIQTGLITSFATTIQLILFMVQDSFAWVAVFLIVPRLFSNSLMASLNARASLRNLSATTALKFDANVQSTRPTEINIAITSIAEQHSTNVDVAKSLGVNVV